MELNKKIIANATVSYLFMAWFFLFAKNNPDINNDFVKSHSKKAIFIHILFFINWLIFISFWTGISFEIYNYSFDNIISIVVNILLFFTLIFWIYKANKWEIFEILKTVKISKNMKLSFEKNKTELSEEDKVTLILTKIPLIWFLIWSKYKENLIIENDLKLNYIITTIMFLLFIFWNINLSNLLFLFYIIFIVFTSVMLFIRNEVMQINLTSIPHLKEIRLYLIAFISYMKTYFSKKDFIKYEDVLFYIKNKEYDRLLKDKKELEAKPHFKLWKNLIYIPILNLISFFNINVLERKHIISWIIITIFVIYLWFTSSFFNETQILLLIPIFAWLWHIKNDSNYEFPFLYDIYLIRKYLKDKSIKIFSFLKTKHKEEKIISLKVGWENN